MILSQKAYFRKNFLHAMAFLSYLPKLKKGLGIASIAFFCMIFHKKCYLFNTLSMDKVSMSYLFSFLRFQTNVLLSSYLDS